MKKKKAFTLIELLVVIAIIALLLAIIMPSLKAAKKIAQGVVCLSDCKQMSLGGTLFANDNDGKLPLSPPGTGKMNWVQPPQDENGDLVNPRNATLEDRTRGIAAGALYPYTGDHKVYHCPGDRRFSSGYKNYLSYAMPAAIGGQVKKLSQISIPQSKYIFVEESDTRAYQVGAWSLGVPEDGRDGWWDGLAVWHNGASTFGFADGHAENHKWKNEQTIERAERDLSGGGAYGYQPYTSGPREDLDWLQAHWPARGMK